MESKTKIIAAVMIAVILVAAAVGAYFALNNSNETKKLTIASNPDFPPYDYMVKDEWTGIDMDICRAVCKEIGYDLEFKSVKFDSIVSDVSSGKYSMGASGISITEDRKQSVIFSDPYATIRNVILVPDGSKITSINDAKNVACGVQNGTTGHTLALDNGFSNIVSYGTFSDVFQNLMLGNIKCAIIDSDTATGFLNSDNHKSSYKVVEGVYMGEEENYAFIFKKSDTALCEKFNGGLKTIKDNGTLQNIIDWYASHGFSNDTPSYWKDHKL